jgi:shikimate dehydrogenase
VISGATRLAAVIGSPVAHSLSPAMHNAAFAHHALDWVFVALHVPPGEAVRALDAARLFGFGGMAVTMPHKEAVAASVDSLDPAAAALRSVNTVVPQPDGSLRGHSTDGAGFVASLAAADVPVADRSVCLLGGGGAARAIADALARAGASLVSVVNRSAAGAEATAALAGVVGEVAGPEAIRSADIVVNATSVGMGTDEVPCDPDLLRPGQVVADIVYHPRRTALLTAATAAGATPVDGLGMLLHQAALQQQLWHGTLPDVAVMREAAERELAARGR